MKSLMKFKKGGGQDRGGGSPKGLSTDAEGAIGKKTQHELMLGKQDQGESRQQQ